MRQTAAGRSGAGQRQADASRWKVTPWILLRGLEMLRLWGGDITPPAINISLRWRPAETGKATGEARDSSPAPFKMCL